MNDKSTVKNTELDSWVGEKMGYLYFRLQKEMDKTRHPFFPDKNFYSCWSGNNADLMVTAKTILSYLDESVGNLSIFFTNNLSETPGSFSVSNGTEVIAINERYKNDPCSAVAVLSHEITHLYLMSRRGIFLTDEQENELLTDIATIYLGLGILVVNGMIFRSNWFITVVALFFGVFYVNTAQSSFGYFKSYQYIKYFKDYLIKNNITNGEAGRYIHPKAWYFFRGIPYRDKLNQKSIFFCEARRKIMLNIIGVLIVFLVIGGYVYFEVVEESQHNEISTMISETDILKDKIDEQEKRTEEIENQLDYYNSVNDVKGYNALVPIYNDLIDEYKKNIDYYNNKIDAINQRLKN